MYLMGSFWAERSAGGVKKQAHKKTMRSLQELEALPIRFIGKSVCLYRLRRAEVNVPHYLFRAAPAKAEIRVCTDMSCHLNGACELRADLKGRFANSRAEDVQIRDVSCLGRCDQAPAIAINDHIFAEVTAGHAERIARSAIRGEDIHEGHHERARNAFKADPYGDGEKYGVVRKLVQTKDWESVLAQLKTAELKGMGD